ncbi:MAG TPA: sigma-70 family RNA polymerase sigma factor [Sedimentisphaerales bacterium]|nr:sigma-70 family RNA polymerase sigma factor [Sedimentisphaerales bacterium]
MEDKLLVLRCKRGSTEALGRIYEKYKTDMLVLAMALLNDKSAAEDVMHDVFLSFVMNIEKFGLTGSLKGYLLTCTANRARNLNKAKHRQSVELDPAEPVNSGSDEPSRAIMCNEQLQQLSNAMAQLPYDQREAIMLHFQAGITFRTIGKSLGISVNTVKSRYRYGLDKLRSILDGEVKNEAS